MRAGAWHLNLLRRGATTPLRREPSSDGSRYAFSAAMIWSTPRMGISTQSGRLFNS